MAIHKKFGLRGRIIGYLYRSWHLNMTFDVMNYILLFSV